MNAAMDAPLYGLVLAGGRSTRMQRDKAALEYRPGQTQLEFAMQLLAPRVTRAFVSVRADQRAEVARAAWSQIVDRGGNRRPDRRHQRGAGRISGQRVAGAGL